MPRILLVEDSEMNRDMLTRRLARKGFDVVIAVDGGEGIERARRDAPDLILMDMSLPVIDGWEATRRLKAAPETRAIPIIALTAHAMNGDREQAMSAGCDDFDTKPVELERLLAKIAALLQPRDAAAPPAAASPARLTVDPARLTDLATLRAFVVDACRDAPEEVRSALELAVDEACTNVIEHGYAGRAPGPITVEVERGGESARVTVVDRGAPFAPAEAPRADLTQGWEERAIGGLGWHLIHRVMDEVRYTPDASSGNRLTLVKRLSRTNTSTT